MPDSVEQAERFPSEERLPHCKSAQHPQIIANSQIAAAQGEGGPQPAGGKFHTDDALAQHAHPSVQGPHRIGGGPQQQSRQKAAQQPVPDQPRAHRNSPRFRVGSS